jgi:hypothetical protein
MKDTEVLKAAALAAGSILYVAAALFVSAIVGGLINPIVGIVLIFFLILTPAFWAVS